MALSTEVYGEVAVIRLEDELTADNVGRFHALSEGPLADGIRNFVLDMEKTEYLDSAGLEAIVELLERLEAAGGQLKCSGLGACCRKVFEVTRLDRRIERFESLIDAVRSFQ